MKKILLVSISLIIATLFPTYSSAENIVNIVEIGAPQNLALFGIYTINPTADIAVAPPCTEVLDYDKSSWKSVPCINSLKFRNILDSNWKNATLIEPSLNSYVKISGKDIYAKEIRLTPSKVSYSLTGGSTSLWKVEINESQSQLFLLEAKLGNEINSTLSLNLVPVEKKSEFSNSLSKDLSSNLVRSNFPENFEYQISLSQSMYMQPLKFVTSSTRNSSVISTAGPGNARPEYIFSGQPQTHSVLVSEVNGCSDSLIPSEAKSKCLRSEQGKLRIEPWDPEMVNFIDGKVIDSFKESLKVAEWSFHAGAYQNSPQSFANIVGCSFPSIFGVMSTNTPVYSIAPPAWDQSTNSLNIRLANSHLDSNSQIQSGYFSFELPLGSAMCLWKLDNLGISANVEILSSDGEKQNVVTSVVSVNTKLDKIRVDISGFTFSTPNIRIRLSNLKKEISCKKVGGTKVVKVKTKVCPVGYSPLAKNNVKSK